jgi:MFS family permease
MLTSVLTIGIGLAALLAGISGAWSPCGFAMIETFTPHMCGSRRRRNLGVALFAGGAILASAALGAILGLAGEGLPTRWTLVLLGALALFGAARDLGIIRMKLPQRRGQVPEPWRREWPLVAWAPAYGIMLGLGVLTFQVVSTFWVVAGAAIAIGNPATAAACFALFGFGRVLMVIIPPPFAPSYAASVANIAPAVSAVRRVNGALLVVIGVLALAASPALGTPALASAADTARASQLASATCHGPKSTGNYWPSISGGTLAWTVGSAAGKPSVSVQRAGHSTAHFACASAPSVDGNALAYATTGGIAVVNWTTGVRSRFLSGDLIRPSLSGPRLAYVKVADNGQTLYVHDFATNTTTEVLHVPVLTDISGPSLSGAVVAWAEDNGHGSSVYERYLNRSGAGATRLIARSVPNTNLICPSIYGSHIAWIIEAGTRLYASTFEYAPLSGAHPRAIWTLRGSESSGAILWGTSLSAHQIYSTIWDFNTNRGSVVHKAL